MSDEDVSSSNSPFGNSKAEKGVVPFSMGDEFSVKNIQKFGCSVSLSTNTNFTKEFPEFVWNTSTSHIVRGLTVSMNGKLLALSVWDTENRIHEASFNRNYNNNTQSTATTATTTANNNNFQLIARLPSGRGATWFCDPAFSIDDKNSVYSGAPLFACPAPKEDYKNVKIWFVCYERQENDENLEFEAEEGKTRNDNNKSSWNEFKILRSTNHNEGIAQIHFSSHRREILTCSDDCHVKVTDIDSDTLVMWYQMKRKVNSCCYAGDTDQFVVGGDDDGNLCVYDRFSKTKGAISSIASFSLKDRINKVLVSNNKTIFAASREGDVHFRDFKVENGNVFSFLDEEKKFDVSMVEKNSYSSKESVYSIAVNKSGSLVATANGGKNCQIFETKNLQCVAYFSSSDWDWMMRCCFHPQHDDLLFVGGDHRENGVMVWKIPNLHWNRRKIALVIREFGKSKCSTEAFAIYNVMMLVALFL